MRVHSIVEKPRPEDAPSNLAVIGRYVFTPEIFDALDRIEPGVGGELQLTDAIGLLLETSRCYGVRVLGRPLRHRPEARLPARQHRAGARPPRPRPRARRRSCVEHRAAPRASAYGRGAGMTLVPLGDAAAPRSSRAVGRARTGRRSPLADALGLVLARADVATDGAGAAVRQHRDGRLRGAGRRHRRARSPARRCGCGSSAISRPGTPRRSRSGTGEAIRIMTGAPIPDGADAIVMVERTAARRRRRGPRRARGRAPGDHVRAAGGDLAGRPARVRRGHGARARRTSACSRASGPVAVRVFPRARVGVLSTGDELRRGPGALAPGQIRDSNRPMLLALRRTTRASSRRPRHRARRRGRASTARARGRARAVRRGDHERRRVGGRLRLREGRARPARRARVAPGRDQARRSRSRSAWCAAPRCSGCRATRCRHS